MEISDADVAIVNIPVGMRLFESYENRLTQDALDTLRIAAQSLSPKEQEEFAVLVRECNAAVLRHFGKYMPDKNKLFDDDMAKRFIVVNQETFETFSREWVDSTHATKYAEGGTMRAFIEEGRFVVTPPVDIWEYLNEESKERLLDWNNQDFEKARKDANGRTMRASTVHV